MVSYTESNVSSREGLSLSSFLLLLGCRCLPWSVLAELFISLHSKFRSSPAFGGLMEVPFCLPCHFGPFPPDKHKDHKAAACFLPAGSLNPWLFSNITLSAARFSSPHRVCQSKVGTTWVTNSRKKYRKRSNRANDNIVFALCHGASCSAMGEELSKRMDDFNKSQATQENKEAQTRSKPKKQGCWH